MQVVCSKEQYSANDKCAGLRGGATVTMTFLVVRNALHCPRASRSGAVANLQVQLHIRPICTMQRQRHLQVEADSGA